MCLSNMIQISLDPCNILSTFICLLSRMFPMFFFLISCKKNILPPPPSIHNAPLSLDVYWSRDPAPHVRWRANKVSPWHFCNPPLGKVFEWQKLTNKTCGKQKMFPRVTSKKQPRMIGMQGPAVPTVPTVPLSPLSSALCRKKQTLFLNHNSCLNQSCVLQQCYERNTRN